MKKYGQNHWNLRFEKNHQKKKNEKKKETFKLRSFAHEVKTIVYALKTKTIVFKNFEGKLNQNRIFSKDKILWDDNFQNKIISLKLAVGLLEFADYLWLCFEQIKL